jgi:hypothetical protein
MRVKAHGCRGWNLSVQENNASGMARVQMENFAFQGGRE